MEKTVSLIWDIFTQRCLRDREVDSLVGDGKCELECQERQRPQKKVWK